MPDITPATDEDRERILTAQNLLRQARDLLKTAGAKHQAQQVRMALHSFDTIHAAQAPAPEVRDFRITVRRIIHEDTVVTVKATNLEGARHQAELNATTLDQSAWEGEAKYSSDDYEAE